MNEIVSLPPPEFVSVNVITLPVVPVAPPDAKVQARRSPFGCVAWLILALPNTPAHAGLVILVFIAAGCGIAELYSAADGEMQPWAATQIVRFGIALVPMIGAALLGIRHWYRAAYWAYALTLALVVAVGLRGFVGMGARRWIDLGLIQLQPSSLMNIALILGLDRKSVV